MALHQIWVAEEIFEVVAKEYTGMAAEIIKEQMWCGAMEGSDVLMIEKHCFYASHKPRGGLIGHNLVVWARHPSCISLGRFLGIILVYVIFISCVRPWSCVRPYTGVRLVVL